MNHEDRGHTNGRATIETERLPIKLWLDVDQVDEGALEQARNLANLPFAFKHIAIRPDVHKGYGMPIGAILATRGAVVPNAVGVDIGCGMCSLRTELTEIATSDLKKVMGIIRETVPVGFKRHETRQDEAWMPERGELPIVEQEYESALYQIGTLGGGNHFMSRDGERRSSVLRVVRTRCGANHESDGSPPRTRSEGRDRIAGGPRDTARYPSPRGSG